MKYRIPDIKEFVDGFEYQAWIGYKWEKVIFPRTGFSESQLPDAIKDGIVRVKVEQN